MINRITLLLFMDLAFWGCEKKRTFSLWKNFCNQFGRRNGWCGQM